jgi:SAM-dependent methyltransferase
VSDYVDAAQPRYDLIASLLRRDFSPPASVVELGSAPGHQIAQLARLGYDATSVDLGAAEDEWGSGGPGQFRAILAEAGVHHVEWDLERLPFPFGDGVFDAAIMTEVVEHLREYPARSLIETRRILRPGGRLYLTTPNAAYLLTRLRLLGGRTVHTPLQDWIGGLPHARHAREYTFAEMRQMLELAGFVVVEEHGRHLHVTSGRRSRSARVGKGLLDGLSRVRPTKGPSIVMVAERPR